jgi:broad specificity phosphatase PhoE
MSDNPVDMRDDATIGAKKLLARAAAADVCAFQGLKVAIDDFFLPEDQRLDERTRSALGVLLRGLVETVEAEIREHGARLLGARGEAKLAVALGDASEPVLARLARSGLLRDPELMAELIARVRQELIGNALPMNASADPDRPSLINRFVQHPDRVVAASAMAVLIAESRRRGGPDVGQLTQTELPAELHHRLIWWVAAALRERVGEGEGSVDALDRALSDAAQRSLAAYDEGERLEAAAMRFAAAIDAQPVELPGLLVESLGDRRIVLFTALLAHAMGVSYALTRDIVLDPTGDRLWLAFRALELRRETIAQTGYALCEADPRRDLESFADTLDAIAAIEAGEARAALAPMRLHSDYRAAVLALGRAGGAK